MRWRGRGGLTRSWGCFCTTRGCWSQCICSTPALAGVGSIPEGTFIATGRERLICMTTAGFSWGVQKISIMFIHSPSKRKYFTSAVWSRSSSAGMCSWPVSEFLEEEPPQGVSQSCCQTVRSICFFLRWQLLMLKIRRCVNSLNYSITCHSFISSLQKNRDTCV